MTKFLNLLCALFFLASAASAQVVDYDTWDRLAAQAHALVQADSANTASLERIRADLVAQRVLFEEEGARNAPQISLLEEQLASLGPVPEEGAAEDAQIADRRAELTEDLAQLRAPGLRAQEAYQQANGLIELIDADLRERQARWVLTRGDSPLLTPGVWEAAPTAMLTSFRLIVTQNQRALSDPDNIAQRREAWPLAVVLVLLGGALMLRGVRVAMRIGTVMRRLTRAHTGVWSFVVSLLQVCLPWAGVFAVVNGVISLRVMGSGGEAFAGAVVFAGVSIWSYRWLATRLYPIDQPALIPVPQSERGAILRVATYLGAVAGLDGILVILSNLTYWSAEVEALWHLPVIALFSVLFWELSRHLRIQDPEQEPGLMRHALNWAVLGLRAAAVLAPVAALLGYSNAAYALADHTQVTLMILALVMVLQRLASDLWVLMTAGRGSRDSLIPTLIGAGVLLAALPLLALVWGARATDLSELWQKFLSGFSIGETRISPAVFMILLGVFVLGFGITRVVQASLRSAVLPKTRLDRGGQNAVVSGVGYVGIFLAGLIAINTAGINLSGLAIVAGALSVGIGFGLQNVVSNFVSGIILLIERPISEGDWIRAGEVEGIVQSISVRSTRVQTFDRSDVIVPNSDLVSGVVTNLTRFNLRGRLVLPVGVAYGTDTRKVEELLREVCVDAPNLDPFVEPFIVFQSFGASSLDMELRVVMVDVNKGLSTRTELNHRIREVFEREGIEIAFPQQDIWIRNASEMRG